MLLMFEALIDDSLCRNKRFGLPVSMLWPGVVMVFCSSWHCSCSVIKLCVSAVLGNFVIVNFYFDINDLGKSWDGTGLDHLVNIIFNINFFVAGPSIRQQLKIDTLNKTLQKEQISTLKERDQVLKVNEFPYYLYRASKIEVYLVEESLGLITGYARNVAYFNSHHIAHI